MQRETVASESRGTSTSETMFASYVFLIDLVDLDPATTQEELLELADSWIREFVHDYCDENNWHRLQAIVLPDGRFATPPFDPEPHIEQLGRASKAQRWETALQLAAQQIARTCEVLVVGTTSEAVLTELWAGLPRELARTYAGLVAPELAARELSGPARNLRQCRVRNYEALCDTRQDKLLAPFGYPTNPYDGVPCMDLRCEPRESIDGAAIVFADLHL